MPFRCAGPAFGAALALASLAVPAFADEIAAIEARLADALGRAAEGDTGPRSFERLGDCRYAEILGTSRWVNGTYTARTEVDFAAAAFDETEIGVAEDGSMAGVGISNSAGIEAVSYRTDYADVPEEGRATLETLGATCDGSTCIRSGTRDRFRITVLGPDPEARAATVEADLLALAAACAPIE